MRNTWIICAAIFSLLALSVATNGQATFTTTGAGVNWTTTGNWTCSCARNYPGESGVTNDIVVIKNDITLSTATPIVVQGITINNSSASAVFTVTAGADLTAGTGGIVILGNAAASSTADAQLKITAANTKVTTSSLTITRNQGSAHSNSSVQVAMEGSSQLTVTGNLTATYLDDNTTNDNVIDILIGLVSNTGDNPSLIIGGNLSLTMNTQSTDNLSLVTEQSAQVSIGGNVTMTLTDGTTGSGIGTIVRVEARTSSSISIAGDIIMNFNDTSSPQPTENVEILLSSNATLSANNISMNSDVNIGGKVNNYIKLSNSSTLTVNGAISFSNALSSPSTSENRIELNNTALIKVFGSINNSKGTFEFLDTGEIQFLGNVAQNFPKLGGTSPSTYKKILVNNTSSTPITLSAAAPVNVSLTLTSGVIKTTLTNILTLNNGATTNIGGQSPASFIDGPIEVVKAAAGLATLTFPVGSGSDWRPVVMTVNHGSDPASTTYTVQAISSSAKSIATMLASTLQWVSLIRYWTIASTKFDIISPPSSLQFYYGTTAINDDAPNHSDLRLASTTAIGGTWLDLVGTATGDGDGSISATVPFGTITSLSYFTLANSKANLNSNKLGNTVLAIKLLDFVAEMDNETNRVHIHWQTVSEEDNDYFLVEKSIDGKAFYPISKVYGAGTTNENNLYEIYDESPFIGHNYYRLKSVDFFGVVETFKTVEVTNEGKRSLSIFPNPGLKGELVYANVNFEIDGLTELLIYNELGILVSRIQVTKSVMPIPELPSGLYFAKISGHSNLAVVRFLKL